MENYKGLYYKETKEQKYYEGGAHFPYKVLFKILLDLGGKIINDEYNNNPINHNNKYINKDINNDDINSLLQKMKDNKNKYKTRNIDSFNYMNNPNSLNYYSSLNMIKQIEQNKKNYISRNDNKLNNLEYQTDLYKKNYSTVFNKNLNKNNKDNHLLHMLLNKKEKEREKLNEEKNNEEVNNINSIDNRYSFLNFYKYNNHFRNRSLYSIDYSGNIKQNKINNVDNISGNIKDNYQVFLKNKMKLIYNYNEFHSPENNGKFKDARETNALTNKNKENISTLYYYSKEKSCLNNYENNKKKSRNINYSNNLEYKTSIDNNKNNENNTNLNYTKKHIHNYLYKTSDSNVIKQEIEKNNDIYMVNINKNNIKKNIKVNKNDMLMQKYKKKKINHFGYFNVNNGKSKSGYNIFAKNINRLNIVNNKYKMK